MAKADMQTLYVGVDEVCRDWGCSKSKGYVIIRQLTRQMLAENPRLLVVQGRINRNFYNEVCLKKD